MEGGGGGREAFPRPAPPEAKLYEPWVLPVLGHVSLPQWWKGPLMEEVTRLSQSEEPRQLVSGVLASFLKIHVLLNNSPALAVLFRCHFSC